MNRVHILTITIKLAIIALIVREVWLLLGIASVTNGIVNFFTIGLIPGTNTTLTPSETFGFASSILLLAFCVIFRRDLNRAIQRRPIITPEPIVAEPVVAVELSAPKPNRLQLIVYILDTYIIEQLAMMIAKYAAVAVGFVIELAKTVIAVSVDFWRQIEPDLWRADEWLEAQFHKFKPTARLLGVTNELLGFLTRQFERSIQLAREFKKGERRS